MCTRMSLDEIEDLDLPSEGSLEVDMNCIKVLHLSRADMKDTGSLVHTVGLGPCIAFVAKGTVEGKNNDEEEDDDDDDADSPCFIALYHWSGNNIVSASKERNKDAHYLEVTQKAISKFLAKISQEIGYDCDISIEELHFIGGQKNSLKPDDNTGTEAEVHAIRTLIPNISQFNATSIKIESTCEISMHFFEATEEESIDVFVNHHDISYIIYETVYEDLVFSQTSSADNSADALVLPQTSSTQKNTSVIEPMLSTFFPIHSSPKTKKRPREETNMEDLRPEKMRKTP